MINFSSHQAGAVIIDKSPASGKGFNNLLNDDRDKYAICSTNEKKWIIVGLSEEVAITSVVIANYEKYSSTVREFQLLGSLKYPTSEWNDLGTYSAQLMLGEQQFNITNSESTHTRYLKIKILSHFLDEELFTLSQIKVYGQTVFASLQDEVARSDENDIKLLLRDVRDDLQRDDWVLGNESGGFVPVAENSADNLVSVSVDANTFTENAVEEPVLGIEPDQEISCSSNVSVDADITIRKDDPACASERNEIDFSGPGLESTDASGSSDSAMSSSGEEVAFLDTKESLESSSDSIVSENSAVDVTTSKEVELGQEVLASDDSMEGKKVTTEAVFQGDGQEELDEGITVEDETFGQIERLQFTRSEWSIVHSALQRSNLTVDFLKGTIRSIRKFFVDPLSQRMDVDNLERFISTQELPSEKITSQVQETLAIPSNVALESSAEVESENSLVSNSNSSEQNSTPIVEVNPESNFGREQENFDEEVKVTEVSGIISEQQSLTQELTSTASVRTTQSSEQLDMEIVAPVQGEGIGNKVATVDDVDSEAQLGGAISTDVIVVTGSEMEDTEKAVNSGSLVEERGSNSTLNSSDSLSIELQPSRSTNAATENVTATKTTAQAGSSATSSATSSPTSMGKAPLATWSTCLDQLKFSDFQARMLAKLQNKNSSGASDSNSSSAMQQQGEFGHATGNVNNNNNIFKQIIQRIKTLETNQAISEIYLSQLSDCLRMMRDEMMDRQLSQEEHDLRARQNPLSALFTLSLLSHNFSAADPQSPVLPNVDGNIQAAVQLSPFLLPLLSPPTKDVPFDAFWLRMIYFTQVLFRICIRFAWIVTMSGRQDQSRLLTDTLQELRQLLQSSVVEFWCALVCGLMISLCIGLFTLLLMSVGLIWCCCRRSSKDGDHLLEKRRIVLRHG
jgi:hypothetical protein